jgi:hypothetical protein
MLMYVPPQVQHGASLNWRCHLDGVQKLIKLRGGFHALAESRSLEPLLICLWLYVGLAKIGLWTLQSIETDFPQRCSDW